MPLMVRMPQPESCSRHRIRLTRSSFYAQERVMHQKLKRDLDPLDRELLERAFEGAWVVVKENEELGDLESDEALEAILRRELFEIACSQGVRDPESLRDLALGVLLDRD